MSNIPQTPADTPLFDLLISSDGYLMCTADDQPIAVKSEADEAYYNVEDINHVESETTSVRDTLMQHGYYVDMNIRTGWQRTDFPTRGELDRIRRNIDALQGSFYPLPEWQEIIYNNTLNLQQADAYEWDLFLLNLYAKRMTALYRHSGATTSGMTGGLIL